MSFNIKNLKDYRLWSSHYLSAPTETWDAMLNMTEAELELISNGDINLFFEKGKVNRVSYISKRYSQGNNKY